MNKIYQLLWRIIVWQSSKGRKFTMKGMGDVKSMSISNKDLIIIIGGEK